MKNLKRRFILSLLWKWGYNSKWSRGQWHLLKTDFESRNFNQENENDDQTRRWNAGFIGKILELLAKEK